MISSLPCRLNTGSLGLRVGGSAPVEKAHSNEAISKDGQWRRLPGWCPRATATSDSARHDDHVRPPRRQGARTGEHVQAFRLALEMGASGLESDVWLTRDGVPVLVHDGELGRRMRRRRIAELRRDELPDHIPTIDDLIDACGTDYHLSLDLKAAQSGQLADGARRLAAAGQWPRVHRADGGPRPGNVITRPRVAPAGRSGCARHRVGRARRAPERTVRAVPGGDRALARCGPVYPCYCTRREIQAEIEEAPRVPHVHRPDGAYPGTCRELTDIDACGTRASGPSPGLAAANERRGDRARRRDRRAFFGRGRRRRAGACRRRPRLQPGSGGRRRRQQLVL